MKTKNRLKVLLIISLIFALSAGMIYAETPDYISVSHGIKVTSYPDADRLTKFDEPYVDYFYDSVAQKLLNPDRSVVLEGVKKVSDFISRTDGTRLYVIKKGEYYGILDQNNEVVLPFNFLTIKSFEDSKNLFLIYSESEGKKRAFYNIDDKKLDTRLKVEFADIYKTSIGECIVAYVDGKYGIIKDGAWLVRPEYFYISNIAGDIYYAYDKNWELFSKDINGNILARTYKYYTDIKSVIIDKKPYAISNVLGLSGLIDSKLQTIAEAKYGKIDIPEDGLVLGKLPGTFEARAIIDLEKGQVSPFRYWHTKRIGESEIYIANLYKNHGQFYRNKDGSILSIDANQVILNSEGKEISDIASDYIVINDMIFKKNLADKKTHRYYRVDETGRVIDKDNVYYIDYNREDPFNSRFIKCKTPSKDNKWRFYDTANGKLTDDISGDKASIHDKYLIVENGAETSIYDYNLKLIRKSKYKVVRSGDGYILEQNPSDKNKYYLYTEWKDEPMIFDDIVWHILDGGYIHTSYALYNKYGERVLKSETKTISHVKDLGGGKHIFRTNDAIELLIYLPPYE